MARPGFQPSPAPRQAAPVPASAVKPPAAAELPLAPQAKPTVCRMVLVRTPQMIGGQYEHAAIITRVFSGDVINVVLMPDGQEPYPVPEVHPAGDPTAGAITWRWPPRT